MKCSIQLGGNALQLFCTKPERKKNQQTILKTKHFMDHLWILNTCRLEVVGRVI